MTEETGTPTADHHCALGDLYETLRAGFRHGREA